jgi:hypothetical protein
MLAWTSSAIASADRKTLSTTKGLSFFEAPGIGAVERAFNIMQSQRPLSGAASY